MIAHRCNGFGLPENSLKAFRAALAAPVDGIEFDVRLTKDRKWVAIHDPFLKNEERRVMRIHERLYSQLKNDVTPLDTLLALFAAYPKSELFIDVKDVGEEKQIIKSIRRYGLLENARIIAWEPEVLRRVHARDPEVKIGMSFVPMNDSLRFIRGEINRPLTKHGVLMAFNKEQSFDKLHGIGRTKHHYLVDLPTLPLYSIQPPTLLCTKRLVRRAHERGIKVYPFGVTRFNVMLARRANVDGFITNAPMRFIGRK